MRQYKFVTDGYLYDEEDNIVIQYDKDKIMANGKSYGSFVTVDEYTKSYIYGSYDRNGTVFIIQPIDSKIASYIETTISQLVEGLGLLHKEQGF